MLDLLLSNARIVDGTGNPWRKGCVGVRDGRIVAVGSAHDMPEARTVLDIGGNILCPGFIDSHSHSDLRIIDEPLALPKIMQGITTKNVGLDSMSVAPISDKNKESWSTSISGLDGVAQKPWGWNGFASYLNALDAAKPSVNLSSYVGLGTVRLDVMGMERQARPPPRRTAPYGRKRGPVHGGRRARHLGGARSTRPSQLPEPRRKPWRVAKAAAALRRHPTTCTCATRPTHMAEAVGRGRSHIERTLPASVFMVDPFQDPRGQELGQRSAALIRRHRPRPARAGIDVAHGPVPVYGGGSTFLHVVVPPWYHSRGDGRPAAKPCAEEREQVKKDMTSTTRKDWENFSQVHGLGEHLRLLGRQRKEPAGAKAKASRRCRLSEALGKSPEDAVLRSADRGTARRGHASGTASYEEDVTAKA